MIFPFFSHQSQNRLSNLVAEHLDHLHYLNDILCLDIPDLNAVLTEHLLHKLFVPLYIFSLTASPSISMAEVTRNLAAVLNKVVDIDVTEINNPRVSCIVALFLLSLVFLVITHGPLVYALAWVILNGDHSVFKDGAVEVLYANFERHEYVALGFGEPEESLEDALESTIISSNSSISGDNESPKIKNTHAQENAIDIVAGTSSSTGESSPILSSSSGKITKEMNITDEEKEKLRDNFVKTRDISKPFLDTILLSLDCAENDYLALLSLCLIYALSNNKGK